MGMVFFWGGGGGGGRGHEGGVARVSARAAQRGAAPTLSLSRARARAALWACPVSLLVQGPALPPPWSTPATP